MELARLLAGHDQVELAGVTGRSAAGSRLGDYLPHLDRYDLVIGSELGDVDIAFLALPHRESAAEAVGLLSRGIKVVDISADFRLKKASLYPEWYGFDHPAAGLLEEAVYGLPELYRHKICQARLVANPGCYPTAAILALAPALKAGIIQQDIIVDAKSGVSGAGRSLGLKSHYCEASEDVSAYALEGHRHLPEMVQEMEVIFRRSLRITFVPHLVPATRGILASCYAPLAREINRDQLRELYRDFYRDGPFVKICRSAPHTKQVAGSNYCMVYPDLDIRNNRLIVISAIDNLVKGAAGQAIQNMNIMYGFKETAGLDMPALYP
jgi:N-acetyl-gamma-glutamyl-phosphate reductase